MQLQSIASSRSLPYGLLQRARLILKTPEGLSNASTSEKLQLCPQSDCKWLKRNLDQGLAGMHHELRPGRPRTISDEKVAAPIRRNLQTRSGDHTRWTVRAAAQNLELNHTTCTREEMVL